MTKALYGIVINPVPETYNGQSFVVTLVWASYTIAVQNGTVAGTSISVEFKWGEYRSGGYPRDVYITLTLNGTTKTVSTPVSIDFGTLSTPFAFSNFGF